jgi:hypothetical protein
MNTFAYAEARIRARHASRPDEALWQNLEASRSLPHCLEKARAGVLERWAGAIEVDATTYDIERTLRALLQAYVEQVADWVPAGWQPSVRWVVGLVDVPLEEGGAASALDVWLKGFRQRLPPAMPGDRRALERVIARFAAHRAELLRAEQSGSDIDVSGLRRTLAHDLGRLLRRHPEQPAAIFAHLGLVALDLERLRSALVARALFRDGSDRSWV